MISFDSYNLLVKRTLKVADSNFLCREELRDYLSERDYELRRSYRLHCY
jgi:hypothetical protein